MNLAELQKEVQAIAEARGWYDNERTFGEFIALIHSELSEALEVYRQRGLDIWDEPRAVKKDPCPPAWERTAFTHDFFFEPCGVASELAGVVIRVASMAEHYGYSLHPDETIEDGDALHLCFEGLDSFGDWLARLHWFAAEAFGYEGSDILVEDSLASLIVGVKRMSANYGIDLDAAIAAKMEYNRTRSYRHGGKAL